MTRHIKILALLCLVFLGGCVPFWRKWGVLSTRPTQTASASNQQSWCYRSLGQVDCYPNIQRLPPESLISVDPPDFYPSSREAYAKALAEAEKSGK